MILNHRMIVERYPFSNEVVGNSIPTVKSSLYLTESTHTHKKKQKNKQTNEKEAKKKQK